MRNLAKKLTTVFMATVITVSASITSYCEQNHSQMYEQIRSNIDELPLSETFIRDKINYYLNDPVFLESYSNDFNSAIEVVNNALHIEYRIQNSIGNNSRVVANNGTLFYCDVDSSIVQEQKTWCGVGSTLMALTGIENYDSNDLVSGYTRPTQSSIATNVVDSNSTAVVWKIVNYLNTKIKSDEYAYVAISSSTTNSQICNYIKYSLAVNRPVILRSYPYGAIDYYDSLFNTGEVARTEAHYIVVEGYDSTTNTFTVSDCTYVNYGNNQYQGRHYNVSMTEIYSCLQKPANAVYDGYIIYA